MEAIFADDYVVDGRGDAEDADEWQDARRVEVVVADLVTRGEVEHDRREDFIVEVV